MYQTQIIQSLQRLTNIFLQITKHNQMGQL